MLFQQNLQCNRFGSQCFGVTLVMTHKRRKCHQARRYSTVQRRWGINWNLCFLRSISSKGFRGSNSCNKSNGDHIWVVQSPCVMCALPWAAPEIMFVHCRCQ
uniref:Uncharacterized protein n=1 Tax=Anguilla anguilla TaxID=7936 RepID=A0A0E9WX83_ANGAN